MANLTATELKVLNNLSNVQNPNVDLGTLVDERTEPHPVFGTPVKWVAASKVLTISGVVKNGEKVTIGSDVYEFTTDAELTVSSPTNIAVDLENVATKASVVLTLAVQPTSGDKVTLGSKVYTFVPVGTANADGEVSIGTSAGEARTNLVAAINGTDGVSPEHTLVAVNVIAGNDLTIRARFGGTAGNSLASTETFTSGSNVFSAATLTGGADCTAANAVTALVSAVTEFDTAGVGAADGAGDTVVLTADEAGVAGNSIAIAETMPNGAFAGGATALSGGVDGDPVWDGKLMVDASYLYVYMGTDWRRIALGSAY